MVFIKKILLILGICSGIIIAIILYFYFWLNHSIVKADVEYYVHRGSSFKTIATELAAKKIISHSLFFNIYSHLTKIDRHIQPGTYLFNKNISPKQIFYKLSKGKTIKVKLTIPEGFNIYQIAQRFAKVFPNTTYLQWLTSFADESIINTLNLTAKINNLEGFLFPQTYFFDPHDQPKFIILTILAEFKKNVSAKLLEQAKLVGLNELELIILASIIEKESQIPQERDKVAAVYLNRRKKHMKLQADPTVIYGLWDSYNGTLTKAELLRPTPYNTYYVRDLPIGPIANPGLNSILSILSPAKTEDLYFVATGNGSHMFSRTLTQHNHAVKIYLQYLREKNDAIKKYNFTR